MHELIILETFFVLSDSQTMTEDAIVRYLSKCQYGEYVYADMANNEFNFGKFIQT